MRDEINRLFDYLSKDKHGKSYFIYVLIFIAVIIGFYTLNYHLVIENIESNFFNDYAIARFYLIEGFNPYSENAISKLATFASENNLEFLPKEPTFGLPIFTLFVYFPFSLIPNLLTAQAIWMTFNQILLLVMLLILFKLFEWQIDGYTSGSLALITIFFYQTWINIIDQNLSIIQMGFLITSMYFEKEQKLTLAGIFLGLCLINPFYFIVPIIVYMTILIKKRNSIIILWMMITIVLIFLSSLLLDSNWVMDYLRIIILNPSIFPFRSSSENFALSIQLTNNALFNLIPFTAIFWMVAEWLRTPYSQFQHQFWILSLSFILGQFITIQPDPINSVLLFPVLIFIANLWNNRTKNKSKIYIFGIGIALSFGLLAWNNVISGDLFLITNFQLINIVTSIFLLINLYWVRVWAISTYSLESD